jgi:hypothetical protein
MKRQFNNRLVQLILTALSCVVPFLPKVCDAQPVRTFGAGAIQFDNRSTPLQTILLFAPTSLATSYTLALPETPPPGSLNILTSDANGQMFWSNGAGFLPALPPGNIWVGNSISVATPYAPTVPGAVMTLDNTNRPIWSTVIPSATTVSASQITSGTIPPGVTINVGPTSTIQTNGGIITANNLNGAGIGKYSGTVPIAFNAPDMTVSYTGIQAGATVLINITDPSLPGVLAFLESITPGAGFKVTFSALYPSSTGTLVYTVINP